MKLKPILGKNRLIFYKACSSTSLMYQFHPILLYLVIFLWYNIVAQIGQRVVKLDLHKLDFVKKFSFSKNESLPKANTLCSKDYATCFFFAWKYFI